MFCWILTGFSVACGLCGRLVAGSAGTGLCDACGRCSIEEATCESVYVNIVPGAGSEDGCLGHCRPREVEVKHTNARVGDSPQLSSR